ncbi:MAG: putative toxin-antitoxin system toxin component, PIN family [Methanobacteriota archaeon]|nr:MAG: putative toxin-antitoxin system toxin component, PIN family [Euryarchaeota archaeon]
MVSSSYFLDTNILISGVLWEGNERNLLRLGRAGKVELSSSTYVLMEVQNTLSDMGHSLVEILEFVLHIRNILRIDDPTMKEMEEYSDLLRDKSDVPVLAAVKTFGHVLVTGDSSLRKRAAKHVDVKTTKEVIAG